jgi:hypothetical protein
MDASATLDRPGAAPFAHGPFLVAPDGTLHPTRPPALRFAWRGRPCLARVEPGMAHLSALLGSPPYTAERRADRPAALAAIRALPAALPAAWRLRVLPDHRLLIEAARPLPERPTAVALVAAMAGFALDLDPYLDRLDSAGMGAPSGPGRLKTWPG